MKIYTYQSRSNRRYFISQAFGLSVKAYVNRSALAVVLLFSLMLTACGGGGGGAAPSQGTTTVTAVALGNLPLTGQALAADASKVFEVTGLTADTFYTFTITGTDTGIAVFEDAALSRQLCGTNSRIQPRSCLAKSAGTSVFIQVQDFSGSADSVELNAVQTPSTVAPLGSLPLTAQPLSPAGIALIEVTGLTPGTFYSISLAATNNLNIVVFDDANFFNFLCSSSTSTPPSLASCAARPTGSSLFVRISDFSASAGSFDFNVVATPLTVLSPGDLPLINETLSAGEITLYAIDGLTPGTTYTVSAVGTNTKDMGVYNNETLNNFLCGSLGSTGVNSCAVTSSATTLFVQLRNSSSVDDSYSFNLVQTPITPVSLGGLPLSGQTVSADENALFEITGLTAGTFYTVSIAGTNNLGLQIYNDATFSSQVCSVDSDATLEICQVRPFGTSTFVRVVDVAGLGDSFELNVVETPVTQVALGDLPLSNQTLPARVNQSILFEITGLTSGSFYNISTVSTTDANDAQPIVFDNSSSNISLCSSVSTEGVARCTAAASSASLFVQVNSFFGSGDVFDLNATEVPVTLSALGVLPLASQTLPANGSTLYEISGLTAGILYTVSATGSNDKALEVFDQRSDRFGVCNSRFSGSGTETCAVTPDGSSLFIRVDDDSGLGDSFELNVAAIPVTPLALGDPALTNQTLPANGTALFEISGLTAGTFYTVTTTGSNSKQLEVINESDGLACGSFSNTGTSECDAEADGTTLFVRVDDVSGLGDSFSFNVIEVPVTSSALNNLPLAGQVVDPNGVSLFEITGLTANTYYTVSVTGIDSTQLEVSDSRASVFALCTSGFSGSGTESCDARANGTSIFVQVRDFSGLGNSFELNVMPTSVTATALGSPLANQLLDPGVRLYQITGLTAGTYYSVSITSGVNVGSMRVYDNQTDEFSICGSFNGTGSEGCDARSSGTSIFVVVSNFSTQGGSFELNVVPTPVTQFNLGDPQLTNQVLSANGFSQFQITGLTPATAYTVSATGTNSKEISALNNRTDDLALCISSPSTTASCDATPSGDSLFVQVFDRSGLGDSFNLDVVVTVF